MSVYCVVFVRACLYVDSLVHASAYEGQRSTADVFLWCALCTLFSEKGHLINPELPVSARVARHSPILHPTAGVTVRLSLDPPLQTSYCRVTVSLSQDPPSSPVVVSSGYW